MDLSSRLFVLRFGHKAANAIPPKGGTTNSLAMRYSSIRHSNAKMVVPKRPELSVEFSKTPIAD